MHDVATTDKAAARELMVFRIGGQEYCIDIMSVREIRGWTPAKPLPHMQNSVLGVINLRGAVLPVVDLAARLGFPPAVPTARHAIIVAQIGEQPVGLLVDAVSEVLTIAANTIQDTPNIGSDGAKTFVRGVIAVENRMVSLIALDSIMPTPEREAA